MAHVKRRPLQHVMEDESVKVLRRLLPKESVIRPYHRDYGIDYVIELFNYVDEEQRMAETLGEHVFVKLKSVLRTDIETVTVHGRGNVAKGALRHAPRDSFPINVIKFQIDTNELLTVEIMGPGVPVLLVLVTPARTRSRMISRSVSANAANKCNKNLDIGLSVPVSIDSVGLRSRIYQHGLLVVSRLPRYRYEAVQGFPWRSPDRVLPRSLVRALGSCFLLWVLFVGVRGLRCGASCGVLVGVTG
jgi:Domain of unknown function (DUF4365)